MAEEIKIKRKLPKHGDDGYKIVSVRMKDELIAQPDQLSSDTNLLLEAAVTIVKVEG